METAEVTFFLRYTKTYATNRFRHSWRHHAHTLIGKRPIEWKQSGDGKFRNVFFPHIHFVDNITAQKVDGNEAID